MTDDSPGVMSERRRAEDGAPVRQPDQRQPDRWPQVAFGDEHAAALPCVVRLTTHGTNETAPVTDSPAPLRPYRTEPRPVRGLAALAGARTVGRAEGVTVTGITQRAQDVQPGDLFAALPGRCAHRADFAPAALAAGAVAVLTDPAGAARSALRELPAVVEGSVPVLVHERPRDVLGVLAAHVYGEPSTALAVLGVTGTSGKTTTTFLLDGALRAAGAHTGLLGTVVSRIGQETLPSAFTTPEAPDLQALLALMVERGVTHVSMEVSSHALAFGRVTGTSFAVGAFTNLSQDHLDFHAGMDDYFQAKARLFDGRAATEVVCIDTEWGARLVRPGTVTVSTTGPASWQAERLAVTGTGLQSFRALGPGGVAVPVTLRLPGIFNVANALLALACAVAIGVDPAAAAAGIGEVDVPGRMQRIDVGQPYLALVDYSHKPAAVAAMLAAVRAHRDSAHIDSTQSTGRVILVLGCGGDRDTGKRPMMGAAAASAADLLVVTDDNPRTEDPAAIRAAVLDGARTVPVELRGEVVEVGDRRAAIEAAVAAAAPGDVVVVAGKGHETGQEINGVNHPFSDAEVLTAAITARLGEVRT